MMNPETIKERDAILRSLNVERYRAWLNRLGMAQALVERDILLMSMHKLRCVLWSRAIDRDEPLPFSEAEVLESAAWLRRNGWDRIPGTTHKKTLVKPPRRE